MRTFNVVFTRSYSVDENLCKERLEDDNPSDHLLKVAAEEIARDWLADEMPEFLDNIMDFMSAEVSIGPGYIPVSETKTKK